MTDFLDFYSKEFHREYRTIGVYKAALVSPLLWACNVDLEGLNVTHKFMRGTFLQKPPRRAAPMPRWSLNVLWKFLLGREFEPLESASPIRLTQKVIALLLLSSGRRRGELSHISRVSAQGPENLVLNWVAGYQPKRHSPSFQPPPPSIGKMRSRREEDLLQCPCRAYNIYLRRSQEWLNTVSPETWPVNLLLVPGTHSPALDNVISVLF